MARSGLVGSGWLGLRGRSRGVGLARLGVVGSRLTWRGRVVTESDTRPSPYAVHLAHLVIRARAPG